MERLAQIQKLLLRLRRLPWITLGVLLGLLAAAIALTTLQTRSRIRAQIAGRDGEILHAMAQMQQSAQVLNDFPEPRDELDRHLDVLLQISRQRGVMGARLFDAQGRFLAPFPEEVVESELDPADLAHLKNRSPVSRFYPELPLSEIFLPESPNETLAATPVLEVSVPLLDADQRLAGTAQFIVEGHSIAAEFAQLDRHLMRQAGFAFVAGGLILAITILWSFRRLTQAHRLLAERTENLLRANQELALAAKTSAVGAVTSHLIHGLKNPLAGLQGFVASLGSSVASQPDVDLQQAIAATRRMQTMINDVVAVLRQEEGTGQYEISLTELIGIIAGRIEPLRREAGVELIVRREAEAILPNRVANLVTLILVNLLQNAVEATPRGRSVMVLMSPAPDGIVCEVRDQGSGVPADRNIFAPCQSSKEGGSGIGLAISQQLALHLGAMLELKSSTPQGSAFTLILPSSLWREKTSSLTLTLG